MSQFSLDVIDARKNVDKVREIWISLYNAEADGFFLSWIWLGSWLSTLPMSANIRLVVGCQDGKYQFAMLVGINRKKFFFYSRSAHLCTVGDHVYDDIVIENNGFLKTPEFKIDDGLIDKIFRALDVHVLVCPHLKPSCNVLLNQLRGDGRHTLRYSLANSYYVDLAALVRTKTDFLGSLSSGKRRQIRKSISLYEQRGVLRFKKADNLSEAQQFYEILVQLHQRSWQSRGQPGAFSNKYLDAFHQQLLRENFDPQCVRIYVFYVGEQVFGAIYGFVEGGTFSFYQSGFRYEGDNRIKPGLVCHALLIQQFMEEGLGRYDFLVGASPYKKSLGTNFYEMARFELVRNKWFSRLIYWASSKFRKEKTNLPLQVLFCPYSFYIGVPVVPSSHKSCWVRLSGTPDL